MTKTFGRPTRYSRAKLKCFLPASKLGIAILGSESGNSMARHSFVQNGYCRIPQHTHTHTQHTYDAQGIKLNDVCALSPVISHPSNDTASAALSLFLSHLNDGCARFITFFGAVNHSSTSRESLAIIKCTSLRIVDQLCPYRGMNVVRR